MQSDTCPPLLIVNDYAPAALALEAMLAGLDVAVRTASCGEEALRFLQQEAVAAILLDVNMPGMGGFEVAETIRQLPGSSATPILFITAARPGDVDQLRGYALGAVDYLNAPVHPVILRAKVAVFVELYRQRRRSLEQAELLAEAQRLAHLGSWDWDVASGQLTWSAALYHLHGRDAAQPPVRFDEHDGRFTPESLARHQAAVAQTLATGQPFEWDLELAEGAGWVTARGMAVRGADGAIIGLRGTVQDISERKQLEVARAEHLQRQRALSRYLATLQESLQQRFSAELHDRISPNLATITLTLDILAKTRSTAARATLLEDMKALLDDTQAGIGEFCADMRPPILDYAGLQPAVENYVAQFSRRTGLRVHLDMPETPGRLPAETEIQLFRIVQEALGNCARHAHASAVHVSLTADDVSVALHVSDDGDGFDLDELASDGAAPGLGLLTLRERATFVGGRFTLMSRPGQGTAISVVVPKDATPWPPAHASPPCASHT